MKSAGRFVDDGEPLAEREAQVRGELEAKRNHLCAAFSHFTVARPQGTYFANVDVGTNAVEFARELPYKAGVVAIPTSVFSAEPERLRPYLRFAFCKRLPVIDEAARRLHALRAPDP